jgi:putative endonuclease
MSANWVLYLLVSDDGKRTYVGVTTDMERRLEQHNGLRPGGAKSTRSGRPWRVLRSQSGFSSRSEVQVEESLLKQLKGDKRVAFFARF